MRPSALSRGYETHKIDEFTICKSNIVPAAGLEPALPSFKGWWAANYPTPERDHMCYLDQSRSPVHDTGRTAAAVSEAFRVALISHGVHALPVYGRDGWYCAPTFPILWRECPIHVVLCA